MAIRRKRKKRYFFTKSFLVLLLLTGWIYWGNHTIQTTAYEMVSNKLNPEASAITVVHISDLHNTMFGEKQERLLTKIRNASPDLIAITGDLVDTTHTNIAAAMDFICGATKIAPVYFVSGNHEAGIGWGKYKELARQMRKEGVNILDNQSKEFIRIKGQRICLMGKEDPGFSHRTAYDFDSSVYTILLSHRAELFQHYVDTKLDLVLSGHLHGGQIRLPFVGGLVAPGNTFLPKYSGGVYEKNNTRMVVSRGLGNSRIPLRINNPPELVVIRLTPESESGQ